MPVSTHVGWGSVLPTLVLPGALSYPHECCPVLSGGLSAVCGYGMSPVSIQLTMLPRGVFEERLAIAPLLPPFPGGPLAFARERASDH